MFFISERYFLDGYHETLNRAEFIEPQYFLDDFDYLIAVTHRWSKPLAPDLGNVNFLDLRNRIRWLVDNRLSETRTHRIAIFYDYCSIYQSKETSDLVDLLGNYFSIHGSLNPYNTRTFLEPTGARRRADLDRLYPMLLIADEVYMTKHRELSARLHDLI